MTESTGRRRLSGIILTGCKFGLSAAILYYLFYRFDFKLLLSQLRPGGAFTVAVLMISGGLVWVIEYCRFYLTLKPVRTPGKRNLLVKVFFSGYAMRFLLPGGHGEIGKMLLVPGSSGGKVTAYVMDKLSFIAVVLVGFVIGFWYLFPARRLYLMIVPVLLLGGFGLVKQVRKGETIKLYLLPGYHYMRVGGMVLGLSLVQFIIVTFQYWYLLRPVGIPPNIVAGVVSIILTVIMLPISIAGLGLREWASWKLFRIFQVPQELALATPLMIFTVNVLIPAIIGAVAFLFVRAGGATNLSQGVSKLLAMGRKKSTSEIPPA
jgi:uncharacterized membrane protein YbhN (UPF0104 family)